MAFLKVKKILLLASGKNKDEAIHNLIYGKVAPEIPGSILQLHQDVIVILDKEAAYLLKENDHEFVYDNTKALNK